MAGLPAVTVRSLLCACPSGVVVQSVATNAVAVRANVPFRDGVRVTPKVACWCAGAPARLDAAPLATYLTVVEPFGPAVELEVQVDPGGLVMTDVPETARLAGTETTVH